ncbi:pyruvate, water dikinase regulatory protein [Ammonifex thiophilus]|uniref:Putative pyruvate, phosphate dikinase regulatory protein n=1 Tax=Ammonifex thiophilus TaxID=444093 RepID=A0A3D8P4S7_9THEO|nr:pyruvate, water dikinase regulatory protein [Ammonifex thiophilus]RDV83277.1 kinase/pyrophosphorylase [Ammonifex thiophilus]
MDGQPVIYVVSDSIGETAELVARAAASQFDSGKVEVRRIPFVNHPEEIPEIVSQAAEERAVIIFTLVMPRLRSILREEAEKKGVRAVDILGPVLEALEASLGRPPRFEPGLMRKVDEEYFRRVEAIEFAVKYDDGKDPRGLSMADLVILGVSRTGKTPLCMYLAHKKIKAANVPLVPEVPLPQELFSVPRDRLVGLTVQPEYLIQIRRERLKALGLPPDAEYARPERVYKELSYAEEVMRKLGCVIIDVTNKAVEETAGKVLEVYYRGLRYRPE